MTTIWNRINTIILLLVLFALLTVIAMLATGARGGPLDPLGPPASTDGVRLPGTPISALPFPINAPGHYYLTRNLTGAEDVNGITINASSVTLDLGGFELVGGGTATGISVPGPQNAIRIYNGTIRQWTEGVSASSAVRSRVDQITVTGTSFRGIILGSDSVIEDCNVSANSGEGIAAERSIVRRCAINDNFYSGLVLVNNNYVHDNLMTENNKSNTSGFGDVRVTGTNNFVTENSIWDLYLIASSDQNDARLNAICAVNDQGTANDAKFESNDIEVSIGHFVPFPGGNIGICTSAP